MIVGTVAHTDQPLDVGRIDLTGTLEGRINESLEFLRLLFPFAVLGEGTDWPGGGERKSLAYRARNPTTHSTVHPADNCTHGTQEAAANSTGSTTCHESGTRRIYQVHRCLSGARGICHLGQVQAGHVDEACGGYVLPVHAPVAVNAQVGVLGHERCALVHLGLYIPDTFRSLRGGQPQLGGIVHTFAELVNQLPQGCLRSVGSRSRRLDLPLGFRGSGLAIRQTFAQGCKILHGRVQVSVFPVLDVAPGDCHVQAVPSFVALRFSMTGPEGSALGIGSTE